MFGCLFWITMKIKNVKLKLESTWQLKVLRKTLDIFKFITSRLRAFLNWYFAKFPPKAPFKLKVQFKNYNEKLVLLLLMCKKIIFKAVFVVYKISGKNLISHPYTIMHPKSKNSPRTSWNYSRTLGQKIILIRNSL